MKPGKKGRGWLPIAILVLGALAPTMANAQTGAEKKAQAKDLCERAARLYDVGKYDEAIAAYEQAYLLVEDPVLLFNIGQAYRLGDRPEDAVRAYKNYLRKRPDASNRADVERKIADLEKTIEDRRKAAGTPPSEPSPAPGNGFPPPPVPAPPSSAAPSPEPSSAALPAPAVQTAGVAVQQPHKKPASETDWLAYGLIGGGGASLVFSVVMAAIGHADAQKLEDASKNHQTFDPAVEKNGKAANVLAVVGLVVGVGAGGVGGYLLWHDSTTKKKTSARLVPALTPEYAGAWAVMTF